MLKKITAVSWISLAVALATQSSSFAAKFANQFVEFELPAQWQCNLEGAEWVCQSADEQKKRDAIIVLAAKLKGDQDSLDQYLEYLKGAKTFNSVQNKQITSEPKYAKTISINGQAWVDSLHLASEIPGFYTRYLATVKSDIGVLVTYSINKDKYQLYVPDFENMVKTLKVFRKPGMSINAQPQNANLFNVAIPPSVGENTVFGVNPQGGNDARPVRRESNDTTFWLLLGGAAVAFIIWRKRRQG